jgi:hypothetical protein
MVSGEPFDGAGLIPRMIAIAWALAVQGSLNFARLRTRCASAMTGASGTPLNDATGIFLQAECVFLKTHLDSDRSEVFDFDCECRARDR